jgi:DNA-binding MarR family transcriptional regulator
VVVFGQLWFLRVACAAASSGGIYRLDNSRYNEYYDVVAGKTKHEGSGRQARGLEEDAFLSLLLTSEALSRNVETVLRAADVSPTQYNVLRILRGSPQGLPCREIGQRMITRDPDITRLLDRLEKRALISRCRETKDRRMVLTRITPQGLRLLSELDAPVAEMHRKQLGHLGRERLRLLMELLEMARKEAG